MFKASIAILNDSCVLLHLKVHATDVIHKDNIKTSAVCRTLHLSLRLKILLEELSGSFQIAHTKRKEAAILRFPQLYLI